MPWAYPSNIPSVAKNWSPEQQKRCIAAGNATLAAGESDQNAIFACIHAAGKSKKKETDMKDVGIVSTKLYKDAAGVSWFFGIYSNNFIDREDEIFSWKSHLEYADWLHQTGVVPQITVFHQPKIPDILWGIAYAAFDSKTVDVEWFNTFIKAVYKDFAIAETKAVIPLNGFMLVIGKVYEDKVEIAQKLMEKEMNGMSHGFISLSDSDNIIETYRSFEFTLLTKMRAANLLTLGGFKGVEMDDKNLREEDRATLDEIFGIGTAERAEEATSRAKELLSSVFASKAVKEEVEAVTEEVTEEVVEEVVPEVVEVVEEPVTPAEVNYDTFKQQIFKDLNVDSLQNTLVKMSEALTAVVGTLEANTKVMNDLSVKVKALEQSDDEKIAAQIAPINWPGLMTKNLVQEGDQEVLARLKEVPPPTAGKEVSTNPLDLGFYRFLQPK